MRPAPPKERAGPARPVGRDLRLDAIRGFSLCMITVTHSGYRVSGTFQGMFGHVGFAEIFVFLSGLVAGMVYLRVAERSGGRAMCRKALKRAGVVYLSYVGLALYIIGYTHLVQGLGADFIPHHGELALEKPGLAALLVPFFVYQPGFADILPMYCVFLLILPGAVAAFRRGLSALFLAGSAAVWLAAQLGLNRAVFGPVVEHFGLSLPFFDIFAWQLLFTVGVFIGMRRESGRPIRIPRSPLLPLVLLPPLLLNIAARYGLFFGDQVAESIRGMPGREVLAPVRLVSFTALALVTAWVGQRWPRLLVRPWLAFIGQHSLQVFVYSCAAVYLGRLWAGAGHRTEALTILAVLASLTIPALLHRRYRMSLSAGR